MHCGQADPQRIRRWDVSKPEVTAQESEGFQGNCATTWAWIIRITLSLFVGTIVLSAQGLRNSCDRSKPNCLICDHKTLSRCVLIRLSFRHPWKWTKRGSPHRKSSARTLSASMVGGKALELRVVFQSLVCQVHLRANTHAQERAW